MVLRSIDLLARTNGVRSLKQYTGVQVVFDSAR